MKKSFALFTITLLLFVLSTLGCGSSGDSPDDPGPCAGISCGDHGTCNDGVCACTDDYSGVVCSTPPSCAVIGCGPNGTCELDVCNCVAGYDGDFCDININDCDPNPCKNGSACTDDIDDYTCDCVAGYDGDNCEINIDDCDHDLCQNGGTCIDGINDYTCDCTDGFGGNNCQNIIVIPCAGNDCGEYATCVNGMCVDTAKIVFVTKNRYTGNLGGATGANAKCQAEAVEAGLKGAFKAWIAEKVVQDPYQTFVKSSVPYILADGTVVANDWDDLVTGWCTPTIRLAADGSDPVLGCVEGGTHDYDCNLVHYTGGFCGEEECGRFGRIGRDPCDAWTSDHWRLYSNQAMLLWDDCLPGGPGSVWTEPCSVPARLWCFQQ